METNQANSGKLEDAENMQEEAIKLYNEGKWDEALELYKKGLETFEELGVQKKISKSYLNLGLFHKDRGEWSEALKYYRDGLEIFKEQNDQNGISKIYNNFGLLYQDRGEWDKALEFYEKSLKINEDLEDLNGKSKVYNNLGILYRNKGEWDKAFEFYQKSLEIKEKLADEQGISRSYNNFGTLYLCKGEWSEALKYYQKSLKIKERLEDKHGISGSYNNLGLLYDNKGEWGKALEYYKESLKIKEKLGDKYGISITYNNLGELYLKSGNWDRAKYYLKSSLKITKRLAPISTVPILENLGELSRLKDKHNAAINILKKSMNIVDNFGAEPKKINIFEKLGDVYLSKYIAKEKAEIKDLELAEDNYSNAFEIAKNLKIPLQEATATRGLGIVKSKKENMADSERYFQRSVEILRKLGASFELQKTTLEHAKALYENNDTFEAEIKAKSVAFDAQKSKNYELLRKTYLLLGDIASKSDDKYEYYLKSLKTAEFNPKIYVRNCYHLIFRMQKMDQIGLMKFIILLRKQNEEKYFDLFLEALDYKIEGKDYDLRELPISLAQELEKFHSISTSIS